MNSLNVEIKGLMPNIEVRKLMASSKALIFPTQCYEGFPMCIVEAFSTGTPVICSDLGNGGSIVEEGVTGYKVKADSLEGLERAIAEINASTDIYHSTLNVYLKNFTEKENYQIIKTIYKLAR